MTVLAKLIHKIKRIIAKSTKISSVEESSFV